MRRLLGSLAAGALLLSFPMDASGGRSTHDMFRMTEIDCGILEAARGPATANLFISVDASTWVEVLVWGSGDMEVDPELTSGDDPGQFTWADGNLAGTIALFDPDGVRSGSATIAATLAPTGVPEADHSRTRDGNHWQRAVTITQRLSVVGELVVGQAHFSLQGCEAATVTTSTFATNPSSYTAHWASTTGECFLETATGEPGYVFFDASRHNVWIDGMVGDFETGPGIRFFGEAPFAPRGFGAQLETFDGLTGEPSDMVTRIDVTLREAGGPAFSQVQRLRGYKFVVRFQPLVVRGTLRVGAMRFDLAGCNADRVKASDLWTAPRGLRSGRVPRNDAPADARLLAVGDRVQTWTRGAEQAAEEPFECLVFDDGEEDAHSVHTVWYRIHGTGQPVTVDTRGSRFDTAVAVYRATARGALRPVANACVDEADDWVEAIVTWDTVSGVDDYVQIGGYPSDFAFGRLRVSVR